MPEGVTELSGNAFGDYDHLRKTTCKRQNAEEPASRCVSHRYMLVLVYRAVRLLHPAVLPRFQSVWITGIAVPGASVAPVHRHDPVWRRCSEPYS